MFNNVFVFKAKINDDGWRDWKKIVGTPATFVVNENLEKIKCQRKVFNRL